MASVRRRNSTQRLWAARVVAAGAMAAAAGLTPTAVWAQAADAPAAQTTWSVTSGNLRLDVYSTYHYNLIDTSTNTTLLAENQASFTFGSSTYNAKTLSNVSIANGVLTGSLTLSGSTKTAQVQLTFPSTGRLSVNVTVNGSTQPASFTEQFADQSENFYGVWETTYPANLSNRGVTANYNGVETTTTNGVFGDSARAPFYMTSQKVGVYVPTQASGSFSFAGGSNAATSFTFNQSTLHYEAYTGTDYKAVLQRYHNAAGAAYMPPDWAFPSIWWRDDAHDIPAASAATNAQQLVAEDAAKLQQYHIPAGAMWLDRPYGSGNPGRDANVGGWGNMDFDPTAFPNPSAMAQDLASKGMKLMAWTANKANNQLYTDATANGWLLPSSSATPAIDLTIPAAYAYVKNMLEKLDTQATLADGTAGIAGYKIDRGGEGEMPTADINTQTTLMQQVAAASLAALHGSDSFEFTRNINDTGRQYAAVWSGDATTSWQGMQSAVRDGIRAGLIYFPTWGSDTGGYSGGAKTDEELFTRWMAFSAYCPMMEILQQGHQPGQSAANDRDIWYDYSPNLLTVTETYTQTHQDLIPYVRSLTYQAVNTGVPVIRAMFLEFPNDTKAADLGDQYMYGSSLLVAPVTTAGVTSRSVYLPAGRWLDYNGRSTVYTSTGQTITAAAPLNTIPVFVREGAIVPRGDIVQVNDNWTPNWAPNLRIEVFPSPQVDGAFSYYAGPSAPVQAINSKLDGHLLRYVAADLTDPGVAEFYLGRFFAMSSLASVRRNGATLAAGAGYTFDAASNTLRVPFAAGAADIQVRLASSPSLNQWQGGSGSFGDTTHWALASVPDGADRVADFMADPGTATAVTVGTPVTLGAIYFGTASRYTLSGSGSITMASNIAPEALMEVAKGGHIVQVPLNVAINTTLTMAPGTSLELDHLTVATGAALQVQASPPSVTPGGGPVLVVGTLTLPGDTDAWSGRIDLQNNDMIVTSGAFAIVVNQVRQGRNLGNWNAANGITSSVAASTSPMGLAVVLAGSLPTVPGAFDGQPISSSAVLVKYAWNGDVDLSGYVDVRDYLLMDASYLTGISNATWIKGDFNYDGKVDWQDYQLADAALSAEGNTVLSNQMVALHSEWFGASYTVAPEPAGIWLLGAAIGLLARRRMRIG